MAPIDAGFTGIRSRDSSRGVETVLKGTYVSDLRDTTDPLAPPFEIRETSWQTIGECFELRHSKLREMKQLLDHYEQGQKTMQTDAVKFDRRDDEFLLVFLRSKRFDVEKAFAKFLNFSRAMTEMPNLRKVDLSLVEKLFSSGSYTIIPGGLEGGDDRMILSMDIKTLMPFLESLGKCKVDDFLVAIFGMLETLMVDIRTQVYGLVIVTDLAGCKMKTFGYLTVQQYLKALELCQNCYPLRTTGMYIINEPWYVRGLLNVMRPFMKESVKQNMLAFGTDVQKMYKYIDRKALLSMYGGTLEWDEDANTKMWVEAVKIRLVDDQF